MKPSDIYALALKKWGLEFQIIMLGEEQAELFKAVSKRIRKGKDGATNENIAEEIADCEIMMEQIALAFGIPRYLIDDAKKEKIERLEPLINK